MTGFDRPRGMSAREEVFVELARRLMLVDQQRAVLDRAGVPSIDADPDHPSWAAVAAVLDDLDRGRLRWLVDLVTGRRILLSADEPEPPVTEARFRAHAETLGLGDTQIDALLDYAGTVPVAIILTRTLGTARGVTWTGTGWVRTSHLTPTGTP